MTGPASPVTPAPGAIDLHAHYLPKLYRASALAHGQSHPDGMPALPKWSAGAAIAMMDETGIAAAAFSLSSPGVAFLASAPERAGLARAVNEDGASAAAAHPGRFALLATLPLPNVDDALAALLSLVSPDQLVYGSDYPFTPAARVRDHLAKALAAETAPGDGPLTAALRTNALRLLPRFTG